MLTGVKVTGIVGTVNVLGFNFGVEIPHTPTVNQAIDRISISDVQLSAQALAVFQDNCGSITLLTCAGKLAR